MSFPTARRVIDVALSQVGTTEDPPGSNHTKYNAAYGAYSQGWAWCGIFQWWCFAQAGIDLRKDAAIPDPQFTPSFWAEAKKAGWVVHADENIQPGDVLFFDFVPPFDTAGIQHVGLATSTPSGGYVKTVEGNTSSGDAGSQDNGGGVFRRTRPLSVIVAAVRPPYGQEDDMPLTDADAAKVAQAIANLPLGRENVSWAVALQRIYNKPAGAAAADIAAALTPALTAAVKALPVGAGLDDATIAKVAAKTIDELSTRTVK